MSDPNGWTPADVVSWLKGWYQDEECTKICNKILSDKITGPVLLQMAADSLLENIGFEPLLAGKCKKRLLDPVRGLVAKYGGVSGGGGGGSIGSGGRGSIKSPGSSADGIITDASQVYAMFPEFEKEMIDMAMTFSGGHESELIDFLLAFNKALTNDMTAQGEQARAKLAEASPDALSNAVAVREGSGETYMSTTKDGFDDEDLYDELAPDEYEDGGYMVLEPLVDTGDGGLLTDALECLDGSVVAAVEDGGFLPPTALISRDRSRDTICFDGDASEEHLEGLLKQFPGFTFEIVNAEYQKAGQDLEKAAWELMMLVQSNPDLPGGAGGAGGGGGDRHATLFKQSERGMQRAASRRAAAGASQPELGGSGSGGAGSSAPPSSDDVDRNRKCREAVAELLHTEKTYCTDVKALLELLLDPMKTHALAKSGASKTLCESFNGTLMQNMWRSVWYLHRRAQQLQAALSKLVNDPNGGGGPEGIAEVVTAMVSKMANSFYQYCGTCFHLQQALRGEPLPALQDIISKANLNPLARQLPITSFLLVPIQRLARYPMLIDAINKRVPATATAMKAALAEAQKGVEEMATMSNERLAKLEDQRNMTAIAGSLDFKRIADPKKMDIKGRTMVKKGIVTALKVNAKGKVLKSKEIDMILFSDMLIYGKPLPQPKNGKTCIVYKQIDRSMFTASSLPASEAATEEVFQLEFIEGDGTSVVIRIQARSAMDKERWLGAFNPKKGKDGGRRKSVDEDLYEDFDAPLVQVVKDFVSADQDMLEIRQGDVIQVSSKDETCGLYKGTLQQTMRTTDRKQVGWFPKAHTFELPSAHLRAKEARKLYAQRKESGAKGVTSNSFK